MPELNLNPTPVDLILTEVLEIYAFLRHTVAKKIGTILSPGEALQWQYFYKFKALRTENKTVIQMQKPNKLGNVMKDSQRTHAPSLSYSHSPRSL